MVSLRTALAGILLLGILLGLGPGAPAQDKPRRIKVLGMGKAESTPILTIWFTTEPSTDAVVFPTRVWEEGSPITPDDIRRYMRIYFPRSYRDLLEFEFFFLAQVDMTFLNVEQQKWIYDALTNYQKGGVNTRSIMSTHSWYYEPWRDSIVSKAFPNDVDAVIADSQHKEGEPGPLIIKDDPDLPDIMKSYKRMIEPLFPQYSGLNTIPKPGSVILSYTKNNVGLGSPIPGQIAHVFYWNWNNSVTFTFRDMVYNAFWSPKESPVSNPYTLDIIANIIWFATGRQLPGDPFKVHEYRRLILNFKIRKSLLVSMLDFAEKFGANPSRVYSRLAEVERVEAESSDLYLDGDFDAAHDTMTSAISQLLDVENDSAKLKDKALAWVYLVEWSTTTGVFLFAGAVLWTLMIKRSLYRETAVTKWAR